MRDEISITGAKVSAVNSARGWIRRLIEHGATRQETEETIDEMTHGVYQELEGALRRREERKLAEAHK